MSVRVLSVPFVNGVAALIVEVSSSGWPDPASDGFGINHRPSEVHSR